MTAVAIQTHDVAIRIRAGRRDLHSGYISETDVVDSEYLFDESTRAHNDSGWRRRARGNRSGVPARLVPRPCSIPIDGSMEDSP